MKEDLDLIKAELVERWPETRIMCSEGNITITGYSESDTLKYTANKEVCSVPARLFSLYFSLLPSRRLRSIVMPKHFASCGGCGSY